MSRQLVLVHGRAQQNKDPAKLKQEWLEALTQGLARNIPPLPPVDPDRVRFPYYGDALDEMTHGRSPDEVTDVILKGDGPDDDTARKFLLAVIDEIRSAYGITDEQIRATHSGAATEKGVLNWPWVRAVLQRLDSLPQLSATTIALATYDVYRYLSNSLIRRKIDSGVLGAMTPGVESIVVGHSLGSVVAYTVLLREGAPAPGSGLPPWQVPLFVTVGSPLAVRAIRDLAPVIGGVGGNRTPSCTSTWFNAMDPRDAVALFPLDAMHFALNPAQPAIDNYLKVDNFTGNRHGIAGYLSDPVVAKRIHTALHDSPA